MLHLIELVYNDAALSEANPRRINDMINFLEQMLDGNHLADEHVAKLQQLGLKALNR